LSDERSVPRREGAHSVHPDASGAAPAPAQGLLALQPRLQAWLGRMGGLADALVRAALPAGRGARWGMEDRVGLQVAFGEEALGGAQLRVWLDSALPQVRTRAAAMHAATLLS
jgi:hypothetical protein